MCLEIYPALKLSVWLMLSSVARIFPVCECVCVCVCEQEKERKRGVSQEETGVSRRR